MLNNALTLKIAWILAGGLYLLSAIWLLSHSPSIPSDDAYFFVLGVERFSILEFRPHFPGYPGFIALGKLVSTADLPAKDAVFYLSIGAALSLPPIAAWVAKSHDATPWGVVLAFCLTLTQPFLPLVGLSMMSDGVGIAFLLLGLGLLAHRKLGWAGFMLAFALCCRPSFAAPVVAIVVVSILKQRQQVLPLILVFIVTLLFAFGAVVALEGGAYLEEAWRFTSGHFLLWGNTTLADQSGRPGWIDGLANEKMTALSLIILCAAFCFTLYGHRKLWPLSVVTLVAIIWTAVAQNPENLRHLLLPGILLGLFLACYGSCKVRMLLAGLSILQAIIVISSISILPRPAPLQSVTETLQKSETSLVISNYGLSFLRTSLPRLQVADMYYRHSTIALKNQFSSSDVIKITASSGQMQQRENQITFPGRVPGEKTYQLHNSK